VTVPLQGGPVDTAPLLRIEGLTKRFGAFVALDGIDLSIARGEFFALLGGSGSGKSTLLRCLAGLAQPDAGRILLDGQDMAGVPPYERPVNMMFQSYALFPHMDVARNIAYGLVQDGLPKPAIRARVEEMLALVRMEGFGGRRPSELSGGQRARVALARALAKRPKLLLLDEPLSALDKNLRQATQFELMGIQRNTGTTFVIVTHDQEEAMTMATRLAVMERGALAQVGPPGEVYEQPNSRFTAQFLGHANILEGVVEQAALRLRDGTLARFRGPAPKPPGQTAWLAIRPERMRIARATGSEPDGENRLAGELRDIAYLGDLFVFHVVTPAGLDLRVTQPNTRRGATVLARGEGVVVSWDEEAGVALAA
jgi:putrescine transport system ATP-binding protein